MQHRIANCLSVSVFCVLIFPALSAHAQVIKGSAAQPPGGVVTVAPPASAAAPAPAATVMPAPVPLTSAPAPAVTTAPVNATSKAATSAAKKKDEAEKKGHKGG